MHEYVQMFIYYVNTYLKQFSLGINKQANGIPVNIFTAKIEAFTNLNVHIIQAKPLWSDFHTCIYWPIAIKIHTYLIAKCQCESVTWPRSDKIK